MMNVRTKIHAFIKEKYQKLNLLFNLHIASKSSKNGSEKSSALGTERGKS